jgi:molybdopterin converting factor small subunit
MIRFEEKSPAHAAVVAPNRKACCAVSWEFVGSETPVAPGDEIGFRPPATGG